MVLADVAVYARGISSESDVVAHALPIYYYNIINFNIIYALTGGLRKKEKLIFILPSGCVIC